MTEVMTARSSPSILMPVIAQYNTTQSDMSVMSESVDLKKLGVFINII